MPIRQAYLTYSALALILELHAMLRSAEEIPVKEAWRNRPFEPLITKHTLEFGMSPNSSPFRITLSVMSLRLDCVYSSSCERRALICQVKLPLRSPTTGQRYSRYYSILISEIVQSPVS